jgi:hypothetical protein
MDEEHIKLFPKLIDSSFFRISEHVHLWIYILLMANHKEAKMIVNGVKMTVFPGQFVTSRPKMAADTGIQESKIERILKTFKSEQQIEHRNLITSRLITVTNWNAYQNSEQQSEQQMNTVRTPFEHRSSTPLLPLSIELEGFDIFWSAYPRKTAKGYAKKIWNRDKPPLEKILKALRWQTNSFEWRKERGSYIPHPSTYLAQSRWEDEPVTVNEREALIL